MTAPERTTVPEPGSTAPPSRPASASGRGARDAGRARPPADAGDRAPPGEESRDPLWYKRAVFYEVLVRGFKDSNGDGTGDLRGLTEKLDYLQWLGVDCLWLLPIYKSPLRDGGYDISRLPEDPAGVRRPRRLRRADGRGALPRACASSPTWSSTTPATSTRGSRPRARTRTARSATSTSGPTPTRSYPDARIIFVDTEKSNWTWDPVRGQYYWHRFFSHQPDLNFDNPKVQEAMLEVLCFWLDLGIDGFRLDAVPYLYVREGTNGENLPETHDFLKRLRKEVDAKYADKVLLAEANQWPSDVVEYFGDYESGGDECHMAFHFPLMPRIFMAVRRESRYPISEILAPDAGDPGELPVGHLPAQPRRADARDGQRRRARLHVLASTPGTRG